MNAVQRSCLKLLPLLVVFAVSLTACVSINSPVTQTYKETEYRAETSAQTYTDNETRIIESRSGSYELTPLFSWGNLYVSFANIEHIWYYAYDIPQEPAYDNIRLYLRIHDQMQYEKAAIRVFDMSAAGHIDYPQPSPEQRENPTPEMLSKWKWISGEFAPIWLNDANYKMSQARFLIGRTNRWSNDESHVLEADAGKASRIAVIISGPENQWNARVSLSASWSRSVTEIYPVTRERQVTSQVPYTVQKQRTVYQEMQVPFWEALFR